MASRRSVLVKSLCFFLYTTNLVLLAFSKRKCSWENCFEWNKDESIIKVHILSHTHDDMGWIKTVDEYYTGENPFNSPASVQYIFNNVISELLNDPNRKFVYAETGFLQLYLEDHGPKELEKLRKLITETVSGQLELIGGGWVQPDEAASHYIELIDQYTLGLRILNDTFGECAVPIVGWQIDPFGHSREHASLLSQMGYNSLYFSRQHHLELDARKLNKSLEFEWNTSDDLGTRIFTGTFSRGTYAPPEQFCFDVLCIHEPIVDNPRLQGYNILQMANNFTSVVREQVSHFKHNHALITMGGDFQYSNANTWFTNLERLMKYINANSSKYKMQLFYSTMSCYTRAILETGTEWPTRSGDFFPYATLPQGYWTGYFTSKPNLKHIIRESSALLQLMREMNVFAKRPKYSVAEEEILERAVSLSMHHDAVTGTSKEYVSADYERRLFNARDVAETAINEAFRVLARKNDSSTMPPRQVFCHLLNETVCSATTQNNSFVITLFNGYSRPMKSFLVRIPYNLKEAVVYDFNKQEIPIVISPSISPGDQLQYQKLRSKYELSFIVDIPPFGFSSYFIHTIPEALPNKESPQMYSQNQNQDIFISNDLITLEFDSNSGLLKNFKDNRREISLPLSQNFYFYEGSISSGAYIFSPMGNEAILMTKKATIVNIVKNKIYQEVYQQFSPYVSQVIRLWANKTFVEFDYIVGPLPKNESCLQTHEIITRYKLDNFNSNGQFKTDANGRQLITRRRNYAADYSFDYANNITGNYYPVNSRILIEDDKNRFTILTDRSQGGSSLKDGEIELMLHRRAFNDDHLGVDENLDEPGEDERGLVIRGSHRLVIENVNETPTHRAMAFEIYHKPKIAFVSLTDENFNENMNNYHKNFNTWYSYLRTDGTTLHNLPQQLNILTLKWLSKNELLLRLEHFYQNGEDSLMSKNVEFDIEKLFGDKIKVIAKEELMLAADRYTDKNRLSKSHTKWIEKWKRQKHLRLEKNKTTDPKLSNSYTKMNKTNGDLIVTMKPMQIRTFKLKIKSKLRERKGKVRMEKPEQMIAENEAKNRKSDEAAPTSCVDSVPPISSSNQASTSGVISTKPRSWVCCSNSASRQKEKEARASSKDARSSANCANGFCRLCALDFVVQPSIHFGSHFHEEQWAVAASLKDANLDNFYSDIEKLSNEWRFAQLPVINKLHLIEAHLADFVKNHRSWGLYSEQGCEALHHSANTAILKCFGANAEKRLSFFMQQQLITAFTNATEFAPKRRSCSVTPEEEEPMFFDGEINLEHDEIVEWYADDE